MDTFDSTEFYGHSLSEDPKLRTTTKNYEFKYNCSDHLEKIINRVHMDRQNRNQHHILNKRRFPPSFERLCAPFSRNEQSAVFKATTIDTRIGMLTSKETIVKVMSDAEIEAMISQAKLITEDLPTNTELPEPNISETDTEPQAPILESNIDSTFTLDTKKQILPVEILPILQPQWVEIRPIHKAISNITYSEKQSHSLSQEVTQQETVSALNLANEESEELRSENISPDATSLGTFMSEDLVLRNAGEKHLEMLTSLRIEPPLSICEREETNKVFPRVDTQLPEIDFNETEISQNESDLKTEDDSECEESEDGSRYNFGNTKRQIEPIVHIQTAENPHQRSSITPKSIKIPASAKSSKVAPQSPKRRLPLSSIDRRMQKQLEVLKEEKTRIFCKITTIQEQIIEIFDKMRMAILELSLPDGQIEKKLRERNAFEFSVRLSRNYLFPLGKMIEELRAASKEDFNSVTTNEPCVRVCGVYGLLNQALQCYYKQLRHFFTDSVPKKLDIILNMVMDTTNTCLQKQIFDKRDTLIESLLMRCGAFLEFVMELSEQKKSARQHETYQRSGRRHMAKASSKWDLTMNLNNLNMYEPKLVSKRPKGKIKKRPSASRLTRRSIGRRSVNSQEDTIALPKPDPVETQVQMIDPSESLQLIQSAIEDQPEHELTKNAIESLQDLTKYEVNQILEPLVSNLDSILKKSDNPQAVQSLVDALNSQLLAGCKQLKTDVAATENITQNSNTYQKEAKKGTDYGCERKENRQKRRESKAKPTINCVSANPNVKEGSTKQTERYNSRFGRTDTKCDKQSLKPNNIDVVEAVAVAVTNTVADADALVVDDSMKQKTRIRNNNVSSGAFLIERVVAKKPTPAPAAPASIRNGIPPPSLAISAVQLDEVIPTPIQTHSTAAATSTQKMTSHRSECLTSMPAMAIPVVDKFAIPAEQLQVVDGGYPNPKGYQRKTVDKMQRKVRDENDDDYDYDYEDANACCETGNRRSPGRKEQRLSYAKNSLYTFISYSGDAIPTSKISNFTNQHELEKVPEEECFTESCTKLTPSSEKRLPKSTLVSSSNIMATTASTETKQKPLDNNDIKPLLKEREEFIEKCKDDPLYSNQQFPEPWKILSKISGTLTDEIVRTFQDDISFGEETYVQDFINMELRS